MAHNFGIVAALSSQKNPTTFQKTIALNDFYWGDESFSYPMGNIQLLGNIPKERISLEAPLFIPDFISKKIAKHTLGSRKIYQILITE